MEKDNYNTWINPKSAPIGEAFVGLIYRKSSNTDGYYYVSPLMKGISGDIYIYNDNAAKDIGVLVGWHPLSSAEIPKIEKVPRVVEYDEFYEIF